MNYIDQIENLHRHIMRDYIMELHKIYTKPASNDIIEVDPFQLCCDEYFQYVNDDIWLKLENRPKVIKLAKKKISAMMTEICLATPTTNVFTRIRNDELCSELGVDLRIGTHHFMFIKYETKEITSTVRSNIIRIFNQVRMRYPMAQVSIGIIQGVYGTGYFDEVNNIYENRADAFLKLIMPYERPTYELTMILKEELAYCFDRELSSILIMDAVDKSSNNGIATQQIIPPVTKNAMEQYQQYSSRYEVPDVYQQIINNRGKKNNKVDLTKTSTKTPTKTSTKTPTKTSTKTPTKTSTKTSTNNNKNRKKQIITEYKDDTEESSEESDVEYVIPQRYQTKAEKINKSGYRKQFQLDAQSDSE